MRRNPWITALAIGLLSLPVARAQDAADVDARRPEEKTGSELTRELRVQLAETRRRLAEVQEQLLAARARHNDLLSRTLDLAERPRFRHGRWTMSDDGSWLAHGSDRGHVTVWRTSQAEPEIRVKLWRFARVAALSFESDGATLRATTDDGQSVPIDLATGEVGERSATFEDGGSYRMAHSPDRALCVDFLPDHRWRLQGTAADGPGYVRLGGTKYARGEAHFTSDGRFVVVSANERVMAYAVPEQVDAGALLHPLWALRSAGTSGLVIKADFGAAEFIRSTLHAKSGVVVTAPSHRSDWPAPTALAGWDVASGERLWERPMSFGITFLAAREADHLLMRSGRSLLFLDPRSGENVREHESEARIQCVSPDASVGFAVDTLGGLTTVPLDSTSER